MKIKANEYEPKDVIRIIREWTEMTQKEFAKSIHMSLSSIQYYEYGLNRYYFETLMKIAEEHGLEITIEKKR